MDSPFGLLAAGLSAVANKTIEFTNDGGANAIALHKETTTRVKVHREEARPVFQSVGESTASIQFGSSSANSSPTMLLPVAVLKLDILVKPESEERFTLKVYPHTTIAEVRREIYSKLGLHSESYYLWHQRLLGDDNTLESYGIKEGDQLDLIRNKKSDGKVFAVSKLALAPRFDFDFTKVKPPLRNSYKRGDEIYQRPYGWKRYALKVVGEFDDDDWLGGLGPRKKSSSGEWPVSYHGTSRNNADSIADTGYFLSMGQRFKFGEGIYSTPDIRIAERYATEFEHEGKKYLIVLQNRVNPITLKKMKNADNIGTEEYWLNPEQSDVRPYGILIKETKYRLFSFPCT